MAFAFKEPAISRADRRALLDLESHPPAAAIERP